MRLSVRDPQSLTAEFDELSARISKYGIFTVKGVADLAVDVENCNAWECCQFLNGETFKLAPFVVVD